MLISASDASGMSACRPVECCKSATPLDESPGRIAAGQSDSRTMATQLICKKCSRVLEFSGDRPSFCSFCGSSLGDPKLDTPSNYDPDAPTVAPSTMPGIPEATGPLPPDPTG